MTPARTFIVPPVSIGEIWPGRGGIYAGLVRGDDGQPDQHLIVADVWSTDKHTWKAAKAWAAGMEVDGHADFSLPADEREAWVLLAAMRDVLTERLPSLLLWLLKTKGSSFAWDCDLGLGLVTFTSRSSELAAVAVRRFDAWSFNPSEATPQ